MFFITCRERSKGHFRYSFSNNQERRNTADFPIMLCTYKLLSLFKGICIIILCFYERTSNFTHQIRTTRKVFGTMSLKHQTIKKKRAEFRSAEV